MKRRVIISRNEASNGNPPFIKPPMRSLSLVVVSRIPTVERKSEPSLEAAIIPPETPTQLISTGSSTKNTVPPRLKSGKRIRKRSMIGTMTFRYAFIEEKGTLATNRTARVKKRSAPFQRGEAKMKEVIQRKTTNDSLGSEPARWRKDLPATYQLRDMK
jgi:hypothetical protein